MTEPEQLSEPTALEPIWIAAPPPRPRPRVWVNWLLLVATLVTTTGFGLLHWLGFQADFHDPELPANWLPLVVHGLWYSLTILAILGAHESGHYLACRYYGIRASLPYFIPMPALIPTGTLGAFIKIQEPITTKRALFDIGIAGPIAGFIVAVPALFLGMWLSHVAVVPMDFRGQELGEPLLFKFASWLVFGHQPEWKSVNMQPMAFAAWFGMLATALNLFPIGQFDGGHVAYAALGKHAHRVTLAALVGAVGLSFYSVSWIGWTLIAVVLLFVFGWRHPPVWDEDVPLDRGRVILAVVALLIFVLCFTPAPITDIDMLAPR